MKSVIERRALQAVIAIGGCVPVGAGIMGIVHGPAWAGILTNADAASHFRYLSGLLLGIGLLFWTAIPAIERQTTRITLLTAIVLVGGLARLTGVIGGDEITGGMLFALTMELVVTPLICLWQRCRVSDSG